MQFRRLVDWLFGRIEEWRRSGRWVVIAASVFAVGYSLAVLIAVARTGTFGLRCVFENTIHAVGVNDWRQTPGVVPDRFRITERAAFQWSPGPPELGSTLLRLGRRPISNYHDYVLSMRDVAGSRGTYVDAAWRPDGSDVVHWGQVRVETPAFGSYFWSLIWFLQEMVVFGVGAWVYWRRPQDDSARLFFWLCVATVGAFMGGYHWTMIVVYRPLIYLFAAFAVFVPVLSLHFYLVFPRVNPFFLLHRRALSALLYGVPTVALTAMWGCMMWSAYMPIYVAESLRLLQSLALGYVWLSVGIFMACLACLFYSFLRARSRAERNQVQWILLATLLALLPISYLLWDTWNAPERLGLTQSAWPMFVVSLLYTAAYATSITRYKLMQAEAFLSRGVWYFLVSLGAALLYSGVLVVFTLLIGEHLAPALSLEAIVAGLTAIVILVLTELARHRFHRAIDRRFDRAKIKFDVAMRKMSRAVGCLVDRETVARRFLEELGEVLHVDWGAIYLTDRDPASPSPLVLVASEGPEPDETVLDADNPLVTALRRRPGSVRGPQTRDLIHNDAATDAMIALGGELAAPVEADGALLGVVILGPKRSGLRYEDEEIAFLSALASLAALSMRSAGIQATLESLNNDLRQKVEKIAEQQRRILILQDQLARQGPEPLPTSSGSGGKSGVAVDTAAFAAIKGSSPAVRSMLDMARKVASSPSAVLIRGESGTGKELLAQAIHFASSRADKPFVQVHCAALSQNLLESELFGHVKGAFTGADRDRIGRFQQADGGTLFLDEIGDINWEVQTKLLRVLQEMAFEKVGSSQTIQVDVRLVAATNQDLESLIRAGRFREDLYYRLNVISLRTPALRDRREDIFELAVHFLSQHARQLGRTVSYLDDSAVEALTAYDWPGNIRQLENVIERAIVLADGPAIRREDLPAEIVQAAAVSRRNVKPSSRESSRLRTQLASTFGRGGTSWSSTIAPTGAEPSETFEEAEIDLTDQEYEAFERHRLIDALREAQGNKSLAARLLGMPRSTLFSRLKKHGLV